MFGTFFSFLWKYLLESKMIKTSVASATGSGLVVIGLVEAKMVEIKDLAAKDKKQVIEYVDYRHDKAMYKIDFLVENIIDVKQSLKVIDDRLYYLNKKVKE